MGDHNKNRRKFLRQSAVVLAGQAVSLSDPSIKAVVDVLPNTLAPLSAHQIPTAARHLIMIASTMGETVAEDYQGTSYQGFGEFLNQIRLEERKEREFDVDLVDSYRYHGIMKFLKAEVDCKLTIGQLLDPQNTRILRDVESFPYTENYEGEFYDNFESADTRTHLGEYSREELDDALQYKYKDFTQKHIKFKDGLSPAYLDKLERESPQKIEEFMTQKSIPEKWTMFLRAYTGNDVEEIKELTSLTLEDFYKDHLAPLLTNKVQRDIQYFLDNETPVSAMGSIFEKFGELNGEEEVLSYMGDLLPDLMPEVNEAKLSYDAAMEMQNRQRRYNSIFAPNRMYVERINEANGTQVYQLSFDFNIASYKTNSDKHALYEWLGADLPFYQDVTEISQNPEDDTQYFVETSAPVLQKVLDSRAINRQWQGETYAPKVSVVDPQSLKP